MRFVLAALALAAAACGQSDATADKQAAQPRVEFAPTKAPIRLTGRVVDEAGLIDPATEQLLTQRLAALEAQTTDQVVVVTIPTLEGQTIEKVALDLGNRWGIGRADLDNGVLLLVAPNERKVRIEVGFGLEGLLSDEKAAAVVRSMLPEFRDHRMQDGILKGVDGIETILLSDKRRPQPKIEPLRKAA
jgi:uncharacterized protein